VLPVFGHIYTADLLSSNDASAQSIYVDGADVYVSGYELDGSNDVAKYWKNGREIALTDGSNGARANSIYVVQE
jgi:hypothetical protein